MQRLPLYYPGLLVVCCSLSAAALPSALGGAPESGRGPTKADAAVTELSHVDVNEKPNAQLPLDLMFSDHTGKRVRLGDVLGGKLPTLLTFNYADCPMLCSVQLGSLATSMSGMGLLPGKDYRIVTIGLDPDETDARAQGMRKRHRAMIEASKNEDDWFFLRSDAQSVRKAADAMGISYTRDAETGEYLHAAVAVVLTPKGKASRYLYGVGISPKTIELSLVEASLGRLGSPLDQAILYCFRYDPDRGSYTPAVRNIMKAGGAVTVFAVLGGIFGLRRRRSQVGGRS